MTEKDAAGCFDIPKQTPAPIHYQDNFPGNQRGNFYKKRGQDRGGYRGDIGEEDSHKERISSRDNLRQGVLIVGTPDIGKLNAPGMTESVQIQGHRLHLLPLRHHPQYSSSIVSSTPFLGNNSSHNEAAQKVVSWYFHLSLILIMNSL